MTPQQQDQMDQEKKGPANPSKFLAATDLSDSMGLPQMVPAFILAADDPKPIRI